MDCTDRNFRVFSCVSWATPEIRSREKFLPHARGHGLKIEPCEEIDRAEFAVDRGSAANFSADGEVCAQQSRDWQRDGTAVDGRAMPTRARTGAPAIFDQVIIGECAKSGEPARLVLRGERTTAGEIARAMGLGIAGDSFPEQAEHHLVAVSVSHAGAAQFDELIAHGFERMKIEFTRTVVSPVQRGIAPGLQTVGADDRTGRTFAHQQVVAGFVELIGIEPGEERIGQSFVKFEIENFETKTLGRADVVDVVGKGQLIPPGDCRGK